MKKIDLKFKTTTNRLVLRPYLDGDEKDFYSMIINDNREHLDELLGSIAQAESEKKIKESIISLSNDWEENTRYVLSYWDKRANTYYGHIWIEPVDSSISNYEIGWFIDKHFQGQGYVTEAAKGALKFLFMDLKANKVIVRVRDHGLYKNKSIAIATRCGFKVEGFLRKSVQVFTSKGPGPIVGEHYYGLLREEYLNSEEMKDR